MGCDIHMFIEYSDWTDRDGDPYWRTFGGQINPGRDYKMFGLLAGVSGDGALFEPRGLPDGKCSYTVADYMRIRIVSPEEHANSDGGTCTLEQAQSWANSTYYGETITNDANGNPTWVTNPDLHSHSWLTAAEFQEVLLTYRTGDSVDLSGVDQADRIIAMEVVAALKGTADTCGAAWDAILASMLAFEVRGCQTRLVFCFDN